MNLRHAAALALVVWHLMYPNRTIRGVTYDSPLSEWDFNDEGFKSKKTANNKRNRTGDTGPILPRMGTIALSLC